MDKLVLEQLFDRLAEIMLEAKCIGKLCLEGLTDTEIAGIIGISKQPSYLASKSGTGDLARVLRYVLTHCLRSAHNWLKIFYLFSNSFVKRGCSSTVESGKSKTTAALSEEVKRNVQGFGKIRISC